MADEQNRVFIGVDGGQSSTRAVAADADGAVLGIGSAGPSNHIDQPGGEDRFRAAVATSVRAALSAAGARPEDVAVIGMGLTGFNERMRGLATALFPDTPVVAAADPLTALYGASAGRQGIVLIAGTGSVAYGRTEDGREARSGGWGHLASDEGSAYWIGLEGLKAAFRSFDGRTGPTPLRESAPARFGVPDVPALHRALYVGEEDRAAIAALAQDVAAAADDGDRVAQGILHHAALHLANLVAAVYRKLWTGQDIACFGQGGVFRSAYLSNQLDEWLERIAPPVLRDEPAGPPLAGALLLAYRARGIEPDDLNWDALCRGVSGGSAQNHA